MKSPRSLLLLLGLVVLNGRAEPRRLALVIGNASYEQSPLPNPGNDADLIAETLQQAGFSVSKHKNLRLGEMKKAIKTFSQQLDNNSVVAFFYAGHGINYSGKNYLLPIGALEDIIEPEQVDDRAISTDYLLGALKTSPTRFLFLDSCRDNPFPWAVHRGWNSRGLAPISNSRGTLISYAAAANSIAVDSSNSRNSPYSRSLAHWLAQPVEIEKALKQVAIEVEAATQNRQNPSYDNMLRGDFYFTKPAAGGSASTSEDTGAPQEKAAAAYERGDFAKTLEIVRPLAEAGDDWSQAILGLMYWKGEGISRNYDSALHWFLEASKRGNNSAKTYIGYMYEQGQGLPKDEREALQWFREAAEGGIAEAQRNMGNYYRDGRGGLERDRQQARRWYEKAVAQNDAAVEFYRQSLTELDELEKEEAEAAITKRTKTKPEKSRSH